MCGSKLFVIKECFPTSIRYMYVHKIIIVVMKLAKKEELLNCRLSTKPSYGIRTSCKTNTSSNECNHFANWHSLSDIKSSYWLFPPLLISIFPSLSYLSLHLHPFLLSPSLLLSLLASADSPSLIHWPQTHNCSLLLPSTKLRISLTLSSSLLLLTNPRSPSTTRCNFAPQACYETPVIDFCESSQFPLGNKKLKLVRNKNGKRYECWFFFSRIFSYSLYEKTLVV